MTKHKETIEVVVAEPIVEPTPSPIKMPKKAKKEQIKVFAGTAVKLVSCPIYVEDTAVRSYANKTGTYYIYNGKESHGRYALVNSIQNVNRTPASAYVIGWIDAKNV